MFHPNIDLEGNICLNILREDWKPVLSISSIIYGLQFLFLVGAAWQANLWHLGLIVSFSSVLVIWMQVCMGHDVLLTLSRDSRFHMLHVYMAV